MADNLLTEECSEWEQALLGFIFETRAEELLDVCVSAVAFRVRKALEELHSMPRAWGIAVCSNRALTV